MSKKATPDSRSRIAPKSCSASKPNNGQTTTPNSGHINPFRSTGIRRQKRPLADAENVDDCDIKDFDAPLCDVALLRDVKASQVIEDFPDDGADFDESDLMQIDDVTTQEMEKEKENR